MKENKNIKILIIEDEAISAMVFCKELEDYGYHICKPAATGEDAVQIAKEEKPDFILADIHLAGKKNGIETVKKILIRNKANIIFVTGYSSQEMTNKIAEFKNAKLLIKPVKTRQIVAIINSMLE